MSKKSFIKYIIQKINEKCTFVTKILLLIFMLSSLIPIPYTKIAYANIIENIIGLYTALITVLTSISIFVLLMSYIEFDMNENEDDDLLFKLYIFMVITPILSILILVLFGILTPLQIGIFFLTIVSILMHIVELLSNIDFDTTQIKTHVDITKIKKIFFKK